MTANRLMILLTFSLGFVPNILASQENKQASEKKSDTVDADLIEAVRQCNAAKVEALIKKGANVNFQVPYGISFGDTASNTYNGLMLALHASTRSTSHYRIDWEPTFRLLLNAGADYQAVNNEKQDILTAIKPNSTLANMVSSVVRVIREYNLNRSHSYTSESLPENIGTQISAANIEVAKDFLKSGGNPDAADAQGRTLLLFAIRDTNFTLLNYILMYGGSINKKVLGFTPIMFAVNANNIKMVRELLLLNAIEIKNYKPNEQTDKAGQTALIVAASKGYMEIVQALLTYEADPNITDKNGLTAYDWAVRNKHEDVASYLASKTTKAKTGRSRAGEQKTRQERPAASDKVANAYATLGIQPTATKDEVKSAYRKLMLKWHPDKNPDNKDEATKKTKEITDAFSTLQKALDFK